MPIIRYTKDATIRYAYLNIYPDQFKTDKEKQDDSYVKNCMDYFANKAYVEYVRNRDTFVKHYDIVKGILRREDFYIEPEVKSFTEILKADLELPAYVKHYSIITTPLNELIGEISKRPDQYRVKAFDDDSKSEELKYKTELLQKYIIEKAKEELYKKAADEGAEISEEEIEQMSLEQVKEQLDTYTSVAEKWGNRLITCIKAEFNMKEKIEDAFRDLLISNREYFHIYEDNSKLGYDIEVINPKNYWQLTVPDRKYSSDPTGRQKGAYASGTVQVMEISEIIESCPELTKEEIDHLRSSLQDFGLINVRESNLGNPNAEIGQDSIMYDTYDPLILQERMLIESEMKENNDGLKDFLGLTSNVSAFGYKYVVVRAYWASKKKVGKVIYEDELGNMQSVLVDEHYKSGTIPTQVSLEWGWINQWYKGLKVGPDIYHMSPLRILNYNPIIGTIHEIKNTESNSFVGMMKPFQVIYNICINQMYKLLEKEIGNVASVSIRRVPRVKDGDGQDDIDIWEMEARERGIMFDDDSPENTKAPITNQTVARNVDLTRTNEIQSRYNLAVQIKNECWELVGVTRQRVGSVTASESATGTQAAMQQSYNQTEPIFIAHEYVMGQVYQAIIDASLYIEAQKPESTLSFITNEGENVFLKVQGSDISLRDLKVFPSNRPEDTQMFKEIRLLAQSIIQNGGSTYDIIELYSSNSVRDMKKKFKDLRDFQMQQQQQAQEMQQQQIEGQQQQAAAQLQQAMQIHQMDMENDNYQKQLDRLSEEKIAIIKATGFGMVGAEDANKNEVPDVMEASKLAAQTNQANQEHSLKLQDMMSKNRQAEQKATIEQEKLKVARENMANDLAIAKQNAKNRNTSSTPKKGGKK